MTKMATFMQIHSIQSIFFIHTQSFTYSIPPKPHLYSFTFHIELKKMCSKMQYTHFLNPFESTKQFKRKERYDSTENVACFVLISRFIYCHLLGSVKGLYIGSSICEHFYVHQYKIIAFNKKNIAFNSGICLFGSTFWLYCIYNFFLIWDFHDNSSIPYERKYHERSAHRGGCKSWLTNLVTFICIVHSVLHTTHMHVYINWKSTIFITLKSKRRRVAALYKNCYISFEAHKRFVSRNSLSRKYV